MENDEIPESDSEENSAKEESDKSNSRQPIPENHKQESSGQKQVKTSVNISVKRHHLKPYRSSVNIRKGVKKKRVFRMDDSVSVKNPIQKAPQNPDTRQTENGQTQDTNSVPVISKQVEAKQPNYMEEKEEEWVMKRFEGLDMASRLKNWGYSYSGYVNKTNKQLKQWLKTIIVFANRKETSVKEITELLSSIKEYQQSFDYKYLPRDYPYFYFIEELKDKIKKSIISFELQGDESAKIFLTEKGKAELTYILIDIDQE